MSRPIEPSAQLGGWTPDVHHTYDPVSQEVLLGNGDILQSAAIGRVSRIMRPTGGGPPPRAIAAAADGSVFYSDSASGSPATYKIRRALTDGSTVPVAEIPSSGGYSPLMARGPGGVYVLSPFTNDDAKNLGVLYFV